MFSNWPHSEEEKGKKTDTEGRERSGMAGLVSAWLRVLVCVCVCSCVSKLLCMQLSLYWHLTFHTIRLGSLPHLCV